jgi:DNA-binding response OmpR family regulator
MTIMTRAERILVVEMNPVISDALALNGGNDLQLLTDIATDGWDAIEKLRTSNYAAIVIDSDLPRRSGFGVLTWLSEENGDNLDNVIFVANESDAMRYRVSDRLRIVAKSDAVTEVAKMIRARA